MSGQPVTTNPILIMCINMAIVFFVLWVLGVVMKILRLIDPTRRRAAAPEENVIVSSVPAQMAQAPADDAQLTAVIMAALAAHGCGKVEILSVKPRKMPCWTRAARVSGLRG